MCKRFAAAASSPELLRDVDVRVSAALPPLAWLTRHCQHVRQLHLDCNRADAGDVAACLSAVGAAGQLTDLTLTSPPTCAVEWLAAMPSLRQLGLCVEDWSPYLLLSQAISGLTALDSLRLGGNVRWEEGLCLPASITRLYIGETDEMPEQVRRSVLGGCGCQAACWAAVVARRECMSCAHLDCMRTCHEWCCSPARLQVARLPRLAWLELEECDFEDGTAELSGLAGSLSRLEVSAGTVPDGLSALTRLQHLSLCYCEAEEAGVVDAALEHLTQLTCLVSGPAPLHRFGCSRFPPAQRACESRHRRD